MLKTDKTVARIPVIIISERSDDATRNRCTMMGAHFVQKGPEALSQVKALVINLLAMNHLANAL